MQESNSEGEEREMWTIIGPRFEEVTFKGFGQAVRIALETARFVGLARVFNSEGVEIVRFRGPIGRSNV